MLHTEIIECLIPLSDESLARIMRMIFDWDKGKPVQVDNDLDKFAWAMILPKLERNKETYTNIVERNRTNGAKGGRPKKVITEDNPMDLSGNPKKHNLNLNLNNISKDILGRDIGIEQEESPEGDSLVSKGLESMENMFPERKRDVGINEINLWNNLSQIQKSNMVKKAALYIRKEEKNESGKYMKKLSKWFNEELDKGVDEDLLPTKPKVAKRTFSHTDGQIDGWLTEKGLTSKEVTTAYSILNHSGLEKDDLRRKVYFSTKEDLLNLIKTNLEQTKK